MPIKQLSNLKSIQKSIDDLLELEEKKASGKVSAADYASIAGILDRHIQKLLESDEIQTFLQYIKTHTELDFTEIEASNFSDDDLKTIAFYARELPAHIERSELETFRLVFMGGGSKGLAYNVEALEDLGILDKVTEVAGASVGSLEAMLIALGYSSKEIKAELDTVDMGSFTQNKDTSNFISKRGLYPVDAMYAKVQDLISKKLEKIQDVVKKIENLDNKNEIIELLKKGTDLSFVELNQLRYLLKETPLKNSLKDLYLSVTEQDENGKVRAVYCGYDCDMGDMSIAQMVTISMSFPGIFQASEIQDKKYQLGEIKVNKYEGKKYYDGGVTANVPYKAFLKGKESTPKNLEEIAKNTICFGLDSHKSKLSADGLHAAKIPDISAGREIASKLLFDGAYGKSFKEQKQEIREFFHHSFFIVNSKNVETATKNISAKARRRIERDSYLDTIEQFVGYGFVSEEKGKEALAKKLEINPNFLMTDKQEDVKENFEKLSTALQQSIELIDDAGFEMRRKGEKGVVQLFKLSEKLQKEKIAIDQKLKTYQSIDYTVEDFELAKKSVSAKVHQTISLAEPMTLKIINAVTKPLSLFLGWVAEKANLSKQGVFNASSLSRHGLFSSSQATLSQAAQLVEQGPRIAPAA